jgi:hypothetical protein
MEATLAATAFPVPQERIRVPALAWLAALVSALAMYLVFQENGALLAHSWETLHELFHDGRHVLGVPCH